MAIPESSPGARPEPVVDRDQYLTMYAQMYRIRVFEEHVNELYTSGKMPGLAHLYIGEEAVAAGVGQALPPADFPTPTHRRPRPRPGQGAGADPALAQPLGQVPG